MALMTGWMTGNPASLYASLTTQPPSFSLMYLPIKNGGVVMGIIAEHVGAELRIVVANMGLTSLVGI